MREWRDGGVDIGDLRVLRGEFEHRLGNGWAKGRLKQGDILVAIRHAGDCFHDYLLLTYTTGTTDGRPQMFFEPVPHPFGAYVLGEHVGKLDQRELELAMAGQRFQIDAIHLPAPKPEWKPLGLSDYIVEQAMQDDPDFANRHKETRIHDWRSHVGENVAAIWTTLTREARLAIAADADWMAGREEYE